jgi:Uma2 family endonuclease
MSEARDLHRMSYAEYLAFEDASETKHEWVNGEVYAMSGGSPEHSRLQARMIVALTLAFTGKPCAPFTSDLRVYIAAAKRSTYPDVTVICDELQRADVDPQAATNPSVLVEVLSPNSEAEDRGEKWALYQRIAGLKHYVLVSQHRPRVEVYSRTDLGWHYAESLPGESFQLAALGVMIEVDQLYAGALAGA